MEMNNVKSIKIPKELTPFLLTAIFAVKNSEWNGYYAIDDFYIYINPVIRKKGDTEFYTVTFLSNDITQDNWMDIGDGFIEVKELNVDIDIKSKCVISIYGGR